MDSQYNVQNISFQDILQRDQNQIQENNNYTINNQYLPIANITKIMKKSIPDQIKISHESKELIQKCVSEFINFITSESYEKCNKDKRKTICVDDLFFSFNSLGYTFNFQALIITKYRRKIQTKEYCQEKNIVVRQNKNQQISENQDSNNQI